MAAGEVQDVVAQGVGREVHGLASDHGARARESAGVVGSEIGVGVDDGDGVRPRTEYRGRDLFVRGDRSVAHLGRTDRKVIAAVGQKRHLRSRAMLGRRAAIQHRQRDAGTLRPIIPRGLRVAASRL
jgi:hypothetical protein